jgi:hypothetical protein
VNRLLLKPTLGRGHFCLRRHKILSIGIDPGVEGGIATYNPNREKPMQAFIMPTEKTGKGNRQRIDAQALWKLLGDELQTTGPYLIAVEKVASMPSDGHVGAFAFGESVGIIRTVVVFLGMHWRLPLETPLPQQWQKSVLRGTSKGKHAAIAYVKQRYPEVNLLRTEKCRVPHDGMSDAVCICAYALSILTAERREDVVPEVR